MVTVCSEVFHHLQQQRENERETVRTRGCRKYEREREKETEAERNAESSGVLSVLSDDMRGNELPDFMHQKRDAPHRLDCQRFLPRIGEMRPPIISFHPLHTGF